MPPMKYAAKSSLLVAAVACGVLGVHARANATGTVLVEQRNGTDPYL